MGRSEVYNALVKYGIEEGMEVSCFSNIGEIYKFSEFFKNVDSFDFSFDRPDAYIKKDNSILIIEHFVVDEYESYINGGSKLVRKFREADKELSIHPLDNGWAHINDKIAENASYELYISNCKARFMQHYEKIGSYKNHLIEESIADENTNFIVCFLMEEISPLGVNMSDGESIHPVCLAKSKEFLEFFEEKVKVDWILSAVLLPEGYKAYFLSQAEVEICKKNTLDYARFQTVFGNPMMTSFKLLIDT